MTRRVAALIRPGVIYDMLEPHDVPVRFMFRTYLHEKHTKQRNCMAMAVRRMLVYGHNCRTPFCVLYKETNPVLARCHLIMFIWLPLVAWTPAYAAIIAAVASPPNFNPGLV